MREYERIRHAERCQARQAQTRRALPAPTAHPELARLAGTRITQWATHSSTPCRAGRAEWVTPWGILLRGLTIARVRTQG
jgi:hypothetical protein